jgi:inner membrane protein
MDSVTQGLLGAAIGAAGFRRTLGRRAVAYGAALGVLPDLDMLSGMAGEWNRLVWHRGPTHSLLLLALAVPLFGWLGWRLGGRRGAWRSWAHLSAWALLTHPLLDWFTPYGTQLFNPVTWRRFAADGIAIIDPLYTLPLLAAVLLSLRREEARLARPLAVGALGLTSLYLLAGVGVSQHFAARTRRELAERGRGAARVRAMPVTLSCNTLWHVAARHPDGSVSSAMLPLIGGGETRYHRIDTDRGPLVEKALASREGRLFAWFADGFLTAHREPGPAGGTRVFLADRRYALASDPASALFQACATFDASGRLLRVERTRREGRVDVGYELHHIWRRVTAAER